jgi:4'-phosphopantetheinyl transferase EntD
MLAELLPAEVIVRESRIANVTGRMFPDEDECVKAAIPRRRREFLAGRCCAREALQKLGVEPASLPSNSDRTPSWPAGVVGSITHSTDHCAVAVALTSQFAGVGIDLEEVSRFDRKLLPFVCTERELSNLRSLSPAEQKKVGTILFSAKESVYKCQYMLTRQWLGFRSVEIDLAPGTGDFRALLPVDFNRFLRERCCTGRYASQNDLVATAIAIRK